MEEEFGKKTHLQITTTHLVLKEANIKAEDVKQKLMPKTKFMPQVQHLIV